MNDHFSRRTMGSSNYVGSEGAFQGRVKAIHIVPKIFAFVYKQNFTYKFKVTIFFMT